MTSGALISEQLRNAAALRAMARRMRRTALTMTLRAGPLGAHLGSALSIMEVCAVLYGGLLRLDPANPYWEQRDRFLLSKGHGALALYTALAEAGYLTPAELESFEVPEGPLSGQPAMCVEKGIEIASGSLGLGLSLGVGIALAARLRGSDYITYVLMGDGECNEGTVWEAAMSAAHFRLGNLVVIVDVNGLQSDGSCDSIMNMGAHAEKWSAFGWEVRTADGHDVEALIQAFTAPRATKSRPLAILARTVKGKGISFMENNNEWHHNRLSRAQYEKALEELPDLTA